MFRNILVPTDGSSVSSKAARAAIALASSLKARITPYHSFEEQPIYNARLHKDREMNRALKQRAREEGKKYVTAIETMAQKAGVPCRSIIEEAAAPHEGILNAAKKHNCDVIFIASHGRSGLSRMILGSVTQKVLAHASKPVVVYR